MNTEDVLKMIKTWNCLYAGQTGGLSIDVVTMSEALDLVAKADWKNVNSGDFIGSRYFISDYGVIVQRPKPSNEMFMVSEDTAKMMKIL